LADSAEGVISVAAVQKQTKSVKVNVLKGKLNKHVHHFESLLTLFAKNYQQTLVCACRRYGLPKLEYF